MFMFNDGMIHSSSGDGQGHVSRTTSLAEVTYSLLDMSTFGRRQRLAE